MPHFSDVCLANKYPPQVRWVRTPRALTFRAWRRNSRADVVGVADVVGRAGAGVRGRVPHAVPVLADGVDACQQSGRIKTKSSSVYTMRQLMSADGLSSTFSDGKQTKN